MQYCVECYTPLDEDILDEVGTVDCSTCFTSYVNELNEHGEGKAVPKSFVPLTEFLGG